MTEFAPPPRGNRTVIESARQPVQRTGATMVTVVLMLPVLFMLSAMAINLAYIQVVRTKVQIVTDASVRAAGRNFIETGSQASALQAARNMAALNPIDSIVLNLDASDLEFGISQRDSKDKPYTFTPGANGNSVRLTTTSFSEGAGSALQPFFPTFGSTMDIRPLCTATNTQTTLDVTLIVDRSGSMAFAADEPTGGTPAAAPSGWSYGDPVPPNSRWLDLVAAVTAFCDELTVTAKIEKIGLVSYSNTATREEQLTVDYTKIDDRNFDISVKFNGGMTNIGDGIAKGIDTVTEPKHCRPWATNALVLMSDGNHNTGTDPILAADEAVIKGIPIYTVSFSSEANQELMQQIAEMTGGKHYHALDAQQLNEAFRNIARRLPSILSQ